MSTAEISGKYLRSRSGNRKIGSISVSERLHTHVSPDNKLGLMLDQGRGRGEVA